MHKSMIAPIVLSASAFASQAQAQTLRSQMPNDFWFEGLPSSNFIGQVLLPNYETSNGGPNLLSYSCNFHLDMQRDGNLVTYAGVGTGSP